MRFIDYIILALRNIRRQKLRSALTIFAVVIGATSVTIMLALVFSVKNFMTKQFEANGTLQQIVVSPQTDITYRDGQNGGNNCQGSGASSVCTKLTDAMVAKIAAVPHVSGVARQTNTGGFQALAFGGQKYRVNGVVAYDANGILTNTILAGRDLSPNDGIGKLTITSDYADKFGFKGRYQQLVGRQISIITQGWYTGIGADIAAQYKMMQQSNGSPNFQPPPTTLVGTIVGVVDSNNNSYTIRVPLEWARAMEEMRQYQVDPAAQQAANNACQRVRGPCNPQPQPVLVTTDQLAANGYSSLTVKVDSTSNVKTALAAIKKLGVGAADAQSYISSQLAIFNILGYVLGGIGGISLAVAAVGVVNTMIMAILERTREIGVMRAVGAKRSTVSRLFTFEASLLGFLGGIVGLGVGYGLVLIANPIINHQLKGNNIASKNIIVLPLWLILGVVGVTTLIGMLAGLYPARRAARLDPVEALHYE